MKEDDNTILIRFVEPPHHNIFPQEVDAVMEEYTTELLSDGMVLFKLFM